MLWNIIDRRQSPYRWKSIDAIMEATAHDNSVKNSDQIELHDDDVLYAERLGVSVIEAVEWAMTEARPVTLYLYDKGTATRVVR